MTFARFARIVALLVVVLAAWWVRSPAEPARVAVLLLPGTPAEAVATPRSIVAGPVVVDGSDLTGAEFWRRLVALGEVEGRGAPLPPALWDAAGTGIRTFGGAERISRGPDSASAFSGGSGGALVEDTDLVAGRIPPPYDRAIEEVTAVAAVLGRDRWSDWLRVTPAPDGPGKPDSRTSEFQFARVGDRAWFFSPAYVVGAGDEAGEAFLRGGDGELKPLLAEHVLQLWQRRTQRLRQSLGSPDDARPVLVFDAIGQELAAVYAPDFVPVAHAAQRDASLASVIDALAEAVGPTGVVLVVGGPSTGRAFAPPWYRLCGGGSASGPAAAAPAPSAMDFAAARALVRYLVGITAGKGGQDPVPAELAARFRVVPRIAWPVAAGSRPARSSTPWSAANLESLPGAVTVGR